MALRVAKAWGMSPKEWRETDLDDRAMMMAFELFESTIEGFRTQHARDHFEKQAKNSGNESRSSTNEFSQMKAQLGIR